MIQIIHDPIPIAKLLEESLNDASGATVVFVGTTRRWTDGMETAFLEYEAYEEMALVQLHSLANEANAKWPIKHLSLVHRIGKVEIKEASVAVVVSTPHRAEAFDAGRWLIDELKKRVPIWKKEWFHASGPTIRKPQWVHPQSTS